MVTATVVPIPGGREVVRFLGREDDIALMILAQEQVAVVAALAHGYTRGRGFLDGNLVSQDLASVLITATARLIENPTQDLRNEIGEVKETFTPFLGWSLAETAVLNRYRKRAL